MVFAERDFVIGVVVNFFTNKPAFLTEESSDATVGLPSAQLTPITPVFHRVLVDFIIMAQPPEVIVPPACVLALEAGTSPLIACIITFFIHDEVEIVWVKVFEIGQ